VKLPLLRFLLRLLYTSVEKTWKDHWGPVSFSVQVAVIVSQSSICRDSTVILGPVNISPKSKLAQNALSLFLCFSNALNVNEQRRWLPRRGAWGRIKKDSTNTTTEILRGWIIESKAYSFKYCLLQLTLCIDDSLKATRHSSLLDNWKRMMLCALERKIM
jgi:hypothetical protein